MDLDFVCIELEITTDNPAQLISALYDSLRNYEVHFKASCCTSLQKLCISCCHHVDCPYGIVFGQKLSSDPEIIRVHQKPPFPFSLYISKIDSKTSSCTVGVVVVGSAINYVEIFHTALQYMIDAVVCAVSVPSKCTLRSYSLDYQGVRHEIDSAESLPTSVILLSGQHILQNTVNSDFIRLSLKSPLRLLSNGSIAHSFDFATFFRSQMRRCSSLFAYYGSGKLELDYIFLSESAQSVTVVDDRIRYIQPSWSKRLNRAGLTGEAECAGLTDQMLPLLILGSYFNAGKGASYGAGYYEIEVM